MMGLTNDRAQSLIYAMINLTKEINRLNRNLERKANKSATNIASNIETNATVEDITVIVEKILTDSKEKKGCL